SRASGTTGNRRTSGPGANLRGWPPRFASNNEETARAFMVTIKSMGVPTIHRPEPWIRTTTGGFQISNSRQVSNAGTRMKFLFTTLGATSRHFAELRIASGTASAGERTSFWSNDEEWRNKGFTRRTSPALAEGSFIVAVVATRDTRAQETATTMKLYLTSAD